MITIQEIFEKMNLSADFQNELLKHSEIIELRKKDFFVRQGEICHQIGIVSYGSLFAYFENDNGDTLVNELYYSQSFFSSYSSFLKQTPSLFNIQAIVDTKIYVIPYEKYISLQSNLAWTQFFKSISDLFFLRKCAKESSLIKYSASERYKQLIDNNRGIEQLFPQYIIASYLNIRPETLSRLKRLDLHQPKL